MSGLARDRLVFMGMGTETAMRMATETGMGTVMVTVANLEAMDETEDHLVYRHHEGMTIAIEDVRL